MDDNGFTDSIHSLAANAAADPDSYDLIVGALAGGLYTHINDFNNSPGMIHAWRIINKHYRAELRYCKRTSQCGADASMPAAKRTIGFFFDRIATPGNSIVAI